jgi:hypothetical protein
MVSSKQNIFMGHDNFPGDTFQFQQDDKRIRWCKQQRTLATWTV